MKALSNYLLVKPDDHYNKVLASDGSVLLEFLDTFYEPEKHAPTSGIVKAHPEALFYEDSTIHNSHALKFDSEIDVQPGDRVIFHYLSKNNAVSTGLVYHDEDSGENWFAVRYDNVYFRIRTDVVTPVNGFVIVEPVDEFIQSVIYIPPALRKKKSVSKGIIRYIGKPVKEYRNFPHLGPDRDDLAAGDTIIFEKFNTVPLQYSMHQVIDRGKILYRMQRRDIIARYNETVKSDYTSSNIFSPRP